MPMSVPRLVLDKDRLFIVRVGVIFRRIPLFKNYVNYYAVGIRNPDVSGFRMVDCRLGSKWSGFRMVGHSKSDLQNVWFSNESGFRMVGFWIPNV